MNSSFGNFIKELRENRGLSQRGLAQKAGIRNSTVARIESDKVKPDPVTLVKLAPALGVSKDTLMSRCGYLEDDLYAPRNLEVYDEKLGRYVPVKKPDDFKQKKEAPVGKTPSEAAIDYFRAENGRDPTEDELRQFLAVAKALFGNLPDKAN